VFFKSILIASIYTQAECVYLYRLIRHASFLSQADAAKRQDRQEKSKKKKAGDEDDEDDTEQTHHSVSSLSCASSTCLPRSLLIQVLSLSLSLTCSTK
jgi:hypothetical protein